MAAKVRSALLLGLALAGLAAGGGPGVALADPGTQIDSGPSEVVTDPYVVFTFSASEEGATFECRLEGPGGDGAFAPCTSPKSLRLDNGDYTFAVRAKDRAGNVDPTPAAKTFSVDLTGIVTTIDAGPSGLTRDADPTFSMSWNSPGATIECRITGAGSPVPDWSDCVSPYTTPTLGSGAYTFYARARSRDGVADRTPAFRRFQVDADPPETALTDGRKDGDLVLTAMPVFTYSSPDATGFKCRIDNSTVNGVDTASWQDCPGGTFTVPKLAGGEHVFEVAAEDAAGNIDPTPAARTFIAAICEQVVRFDVAEIKGTCLRTVGTKDAPRWESAEPVSLNGMSIPTPAGHKLEIVAPTDSGGGSLKVRDVKIDVGPFTLFRGDLSLTIPKIDAGKDPAQTQEADIRRFNVGELAQKIAGLDVLGDVGLRLGRRGDHYYGLLDLHVGLPRIFKSGPDKDAASITGDTALLFDEQGTHLDGLRVLVEHAYVGGVGIDSACLSYKAAGNVSVNVCPAPLGDQFLACPRRAGVDAWDMSLVLGLPTPSKTKIGMWGGLSIGTTAGGAPDARLAYAGVMAQNMNVPVGPGWTWDRAAVGLCVDPPPFEIKGEAGFKGVELFGQSQVDINGSLQYTDAHDGHPWRFKAEGAMKFFQNEGTGLTGRVEFGPTDVDFAARLKLGFGPVKLEGGVAGWLQWSPVVFNLEGDIQLCVDEACGGAKALVSSRGIAGCLTYVGPAIPTLVLDKDWSILTPWKVHWEFKPVTISLGAGQAWETRKIDLLAGACDLQPWAAQKTTMARAAQAGRPTVTIAKDQPVAAIRVRGRGAPPKVALVGPDGRRVAAAPGSRGAIVEGQHVILEDQQTNSTNVAILKPQAGPWTVEVLDGSAPIAGIDYSEPRPEPMIAGGVGGKGHDRALAYVHRPLAGEKVTFVERGSDTQQTLGTAAGGKCAHPVNTRGGGEILCGKLPFHPGRGPAGRRRIVAVVEQGGIVRDNIVVATYRAPAERKPATPRKLRLRRKGSKLIIAWRGDKSVYRYNVVVNGNDGSRRLFFGSARWPRVVAEGLDPRHTVGVTVTPMRNDLVEGRAAKASAKPQRSGKPKRRAPIRRKRKPRR